MRPGSPIRRPGRTRGPASPQERAYCEPYIADPYFCDVWFAEVQFCITARSGRSRAAGGIGPCGGVGHLAGGAREGGGGRGATPPRHAATAPWVGDGVFLVRGD